MATPTELYNSALWKTPEEKDTVDRLIAEAKRQSDENVATDDDVSDLEDDLAVHIADTTLHKTANGPPTYFYPMKDGEKLFPEIVGLVDEGATASYATPQKWLDDNGVQQEGVILESNVFRPEKCTGLSLPCYIVVEYCVAPVVAAATSATFSIAYQLINNDESFGTGFTKNPRSGGGEYVLPIPAGVEFEYHRTALYMIDVEVLDFDVFLAEIKRSYGSFSDAFRDIVYVLGWKVIFGWLENVPEQTVYPP